jgi:hypothetical protein
MNEKVKSDAFEAPDQITVDITIRDKTAQYIIREESGAKFTELFADVNSDDPTKKRKAQRDLPANLIAACVWRGDGSSITFAEASAMRHTLQKRLSAEVLKLNALTDDAEADAKNA